MSWKAANVRKVCTCDRTFWTSTDVLQDAQVVVDMGSTQECRARIEQEMVDKVMQLNSRHMEIKKKLCKSLMSVPKKGKMVSQISIQAGRQA